MFCSYRFLGSPLLFAVALTFTGCGGGVSDGGDAGTIEATFSSIQDNVFTPTCAIGGCHTNADQAGGLTLEEGVAYSAIIDVASNELPTMHLITPGDTEESYLIHKLMGTYLDVGGSGAQMPIGGSISEEELATIEEWVLAGAPED